MKTEYPVALKQPTDKTIGGLVSAIVEQVDREPGSFLMPEWIIRHITDYLLATEKLPQQVMAFLKGSPARANPQFLSHQPCDSMARVQGFVINALPMQTAAWHRDVIFPSSLVQNLSYIRGSHQG